MLDFFNDPRNVGMLLVASVTTLVGLIAWALLAPWARSLWLSTQEPPTTEELDAVRESRLAGSFRLPGRTSATARHFEGPLPVARDPAPSGARGCYEPILVTDWRDRRTDG